VGEEGGCVLMIALPIIQMCINRDIDIYTVKIHGMAEAVNFCQAEGTSPTIISKQSIGILWNDSIL